jgi:hypothetical protein
MTMEREYLEQAMTEAERAYAGSAKSMGSSLLGQVPAPSGPLIGLIQQGDALRARVCSVTMQLAEHNVKVIGPVPESNSATKDARIGGDGAIGELQRCLDGLTNAIDGLESEARRACTLV